MARFAVALVVASLLATVGCGRGTLALKPEVVSGKDDVVWVVRVVRTAGPSNPVVYGLFACYRPPADNPGPPTCYVAKTVGGSKALGWPGTEMLILNGRLRPFAR